MNGRPSSLIVSLLLLVLVWPGGSTAQVRWRALNLQAGVAFGPNEFAGAGLSLAGELGVRDPLRVFAQWTDWRVLGSCAVLDAASECNVDAHLWELGLRYGLDIGEKVAPFAGAGLGMYRRRSGPNSDPTTSAIVSVAAGLDIRATGPLAIRLSFVHQEVLDGELGDRYGTGVRFTGLLAGLGIAVW